MSITKKDNMVILGLLGTLACSEPEDKTGVYEQIAETGGDDGLLVPDVDIPDEGEEAVLLPPGECLQLPLSGTYGYTHQCTGAIELSINAKGDVLEESFTFGPGASNPKYWTEPDSYALPLVAACCGPYNYEAPTFEQKKPYLNNCLLDSAQQICHALPYFLRRQASKTEELIKKAALNNLADEVAKREGECMSSLWGGGPTEDNPNRLLGASWTPVNDVTITLVDSEVYDWTTEGQVVWDECYSIEDNDPAVIPTAPLIVPGSVAATQATLAPGASMAGSGPAGASGSFAPTPGGMLTVAHMVDGSVRVTGLQLDAGPTTVGTSDLRIELERSSLGLRDVMAPRSAGGEHVVGSGDAVFVVTTTFEGGSRTIDFTNVDPIVFRETSTGDWEFEPFELAYDEPGVGIWTLSFDGLLFQTGF